MPLSWRNRRNYFFTPPLWYFHRALAGRDRHNTFHGNLIGVKILIVRNNQYISLDNITFYD